MMFILRLFATPKMRWLFGNPNFVAVQVAKHYYLKIYIYIYIYFFFKGTDSDINNSVSSSSRSCRFNSMIITKYWRAHALTKFYNISIIIIINILEPLKYCEAHVVPEGGGHGWQSLSSTLYGQRFWMIILGFHFFSFHTSI